MNETLVCSVVDNLPFPLPRKMSGDWNGDWFTADPVRSLSSSFTTSDTVIRGGFATDLLQRHAFCFS